MAGALTRQEGCVPESILIEFAAGELAADARPALDAHLAACSVCLGALAVWRERSMDRSLEGAQLATRPSASDGELEAPLVSGARVGRYIVLEAVGAGAMGTVYAALDPELDRRVALKVLRSRATTEELRARLLREAKAMARIIHPDVITVYDVGTRGKQLFVAMEFVKGGTLRGWSAPARGWRTVLEKYIRAGRGLAFAHAAGVVHRDFKPDNVLVGDDERVRVTDFGLARAVEDDANALRSFPSAEGAPIDATLTRTGAIVGTPAYMAPEQICGAPASPASDMFSFSVALYEALYGERPFAGANLAALYAAASEGAVRPAPATSSVPRRLRRVVLRGLRAAPEERYANMAALLDALEAAVRFRASRLVAIGAALALVAALGVWAARAAATSSPLAEGSSRAEAAPVSAPLPAAPTASAAEDDALPAPGAPAPAPAPARVEPASRRAGARPRATSVTPPASPPSTPPPASVAPRQGSASASASAVVESTAVSASSGDVRVGSHGVPILP